MFETTNQQLIYALIWSYMKVSCYQTWAPWSWNMHSSVYTWTLQRIPQTNPNPLKQKKTDIGSIYRQFQAWIFAFPSFLGFYGAFPEKNGGTPMVHLRGAELISPWNSRIDTSWHLAGGWFSSRCDHGWKVTDQMEVLRGFSIAMFDHRRVLGDSRGGYWDMLSDIWGIVLVSSWWCWFWNHVGPHPAFMIKLQAKVWTLKSFKIFFEKISINIHFWKLNWKEISKDLKSSQKYAYTHVCMCIYIYISLFGYPWTCLNTSIRLETLALAGAGKGDAAFTTACFSSLAPPEAMEPHGTPNMMIIH